MEHQSKNDTNQIDSSSNTAVQVHVQKNVCCMTICESLEKQALAVAKMKEQKLNRNTRSIIYSYLGIKDFLNKALKLSRDERIHNIRCFNRCLLFRSTNLHEFSDFRQLIFCLDMAKSIQVNVDFYGPMIESSIL